MPSAVMKKTAKQNRPSKTARGKLQNACVLTRSQSCGRGRKPRRRQRRRRGRRRPRSARGPHWRAREMGDDGLNVTWPSSRSESLQPSSHNARLAVPPIVWRQGRVARCAGLLPPVTRLLPASATASSSPGQARAPAPAQGAARSLPRPARQSPRPRGKAGRTARTGRARCAWR